jgi:hypothetical protein
MNTSVRIVALVGAMLTSSLLLADEQSDIKQQIAQINGQVVGLPADSVIEPSKCDTLACELSDAGISFIKPSDRNVITVFSEQDGIKACQLLKTIPYQAVVKYNGKVLCD